MNARLSPDARHAFSGTAIDRSKTVHFRLDGYRIEAFAGDTVLSAIMAAGVQTVGRHTGFPVGIGPDFAPPVIAGTTGTGAAATIPMDRVPVRDGLVLNTLDGTRAGPAMRLGQRLAGRRRTALGIDLDKKGTSRDPDFVPDAETGWHGDLAVVGAGVAGMSAAIEGVRAGLSVLLIERRGQWSGDALLFGNREGEEAASDLIARLGAEAEGLDGLTIWTHAEAQVSSDGALVVHRAMFDDGQLRAGLSQVDAEKVILATGAEDRLPLFAGNRLPGVIPLASAFHLAHDYGIWPGATAVIAGSVSITYRMAMLAHDAGVQIDRVVDSRHRPRSRFLEFAKAYGVRTAASSRIAAAEPAPEGGLTVRLGSAWDEVAPDADAFVTERLVVNDGWLPRLGLWRRLGGGCGMDAAGERLVATVAPDGLALAGSAAGFAGTAAAAESGRQAVAALLGRDTQEIPDEPLPELYESGDGQPMRALLGDGPAPAYLCGGQSLTFASASTPSKRRLLPRPPKPADFAPNRAGSGTLILEDVEALVRLGEIAPHFVDAVLAERMVPAEPVVAKPADPVPDNNDSSGDGPAWVPAYLSGRFGDGPMLCWLDVEGGHRLDAGAFVFSGSDQTAARNAIGAVLGGDGGNQTALLARAHAVVGATVTIRGIAGISRAAISTCRDADL